MRQIVELSMDELEQVEGCPLFIPALALAFSVIAAASAGGYMIGKDMAERDNADR